MSSPGIRFGAMAPKVSEQVAIPEDLADQVDGNADAITRLYLHGLLTDSEARAARVRLLKKLDKDLARRAKP